MSIDFKLKEFYYPLEILSFRNFLEKSQWFSEEELTRYQLKRLQIIIRHCYYNVPYYTELFNRLNLKPSDIKTLDDLKKIPTLTKQKIRQHFKQLIAKNARRFNMQRCQTSGTSGEPIQFYLDKSSRILEFCYYWRYWSWAGYRLGMPFAELGLHHFLDTDITMISSYSSLTKKLSLNAGQLSRENLNKYINAIKNHRVLFLKGSPSSVYLFANLVDKYAPQALSFEKVFTAGEILLNHQRQKIKEVFGCKTIDSYGHMERTVAISQ
jgi:phenylacetate-CoA ligase